MKDASTAGGRGGLSSEGAAGTGTASRVSGQELRGETSESTAPATPASGAFVDTEQMECGHLVSETVDAGTPRERCGVCHPARPTLTMSEALYWLERRATVQRRERTSRTRNRWTLRDIEAVETIISVVRAAEAMGAGRDDGDEPETYTNGDQVRP